MPAVRAYVIAEAGVNHNGSLELALKLVDEAKAAGADAVKFQTFTTAGVVSRFAIKAPYQAESTGSDGNQMDMIRKLELSEGDHRKLEARAIEQGIEFLSTPFDVPSVELLVRMGLKTLKIPSGEINNPILLRAVARTQRKILMSTGMATLGEIEWALSTLAQAAQEGFTAAEAYRSDLGQTWLRNHVTLLHCTTEYPAPDVDVNLAVMATMRSAFGLPVGYSDHTTGIAVSIGAAALGAVVIEKHFTLDRSMDGPDHKASLEPAELAAMVQGIRQVQTAIGRPEKYPSPSEQKNMAAARRSLVALKDIRAGEAFSKENLGIKRPGTGVSPTRFDEFLGQAAHRAFGEDELIDEKR